MEKCGCYRPCGNFVDSLGRPKGAIQAHFGPKKWVRLIIFIRIFQFIWDLGLLSSDSPKDLVFGKNLFFGKIYCFPGVSQAQKQTKTENFGYVPLLLRDLILKHCSHNVFVLSWTTSGPNFNKIEPVWGEKRPGNPKKGSISWLPHHHENI